MEILFNHDEPTYIFIEVDWQMAGYARLGLMMSGDLRDDAGLWKRWEI